MRTRPVTIIAMLCTGMLCLSLGGTGRAIELSTGLTLREIDDRLDCCVANVSNVPFTVKDIVICSTDGCEFPTAASARGLTPRLIGATAGFCMETPGESCGFLSGCVRVQKYYRCKFEIPDNISPEAVRGTLRIGEKVLDAHPMPALPTCGAAAAPQCNGSCESPGHFCRATSRGCACTID